MALILEPLRGHFMGTIAGHGSNAKKASGQAYQSYRQTTLERSVQALCIGATMGVLFG